MLYTHGDMGTLPQEFLHPPQVSWAQQDWTENLSGTQLPAANFIYMVLDTLLHMCCIYALLKAPT